MPVDYERLVGRRIGFPPECAEKWRRHSHALVDDGAEVFRDVQLGYGLYGTARGEICPNLVGKAGVHSRVSREVEENGAQSCGDGEATCVFVSISC